MSIRASAPAQETLRGLSDEIEDLKERELSKLTVGELAAGLLVILGIAFVVAFWLWMSPQG